MTMASAPDSIYGHQASMLARILSSPPSWSPVWKRIAPQQPASLATTSCTPSLSSTRAVATLILGDIAGCTQPSSSSILRVWVVRGHGPVGGVMAGTLLRSATGSIGRTIWPSFSAGPNSLGRVSPSRSSQRAIRSFAGRWIPAASSRSSTTFRPISTSRPYFTPDGQVDSQLRQVRQRSRCSRVLSVTGWPSSICFIR
ncbi:hypothetical protein D3C86_1329580 [compost metagenome]